MNSSISPDILSFEEFQAAIVSGLHDRLDDNYTVTCREIVKNNGISLRGIIIRKGNDKITPTIYLDDMYPPYSEGIVTLEDTVTQILAIYYNCLNSCDGIDIGEFSFDDVKDNIIFKLINREFNSTRLQNAPHYIVEDLAVVFCVYVKINGLGSGTITIDNSIASKWGVSAGELLDKAIINTPIHFPPVFCDMVTMLKKLVGEHLSGGNSDEENEERYRLIEQIDKDDVKIPMYVLTSSNGIGGAGCLLYPGMLESIHNELGSDFFIIPSSVNEVIIVLEEVSPKCAFEMMVNEVNNKDVDEMDRLSYKVYSYPEDKFELAL